MSSLCRTSGRVVGAAAALTLLTTGTAAAATTADLYVDQAPQLAGERTVGSTLTYTIGVFNQGPEATSATFTDQLGAVEQLVDVATTAGSCTQAPPVSCALGTLQPGTGATITLRVKLTKAGADEHAYRVDGPADNTDVNLNDNLGGVGFTVDEPVVPEVQTPTVGPVMASETGQTHLDVEALLTPYGKGTWWLEYGTSKAYGRRTAAQTVSGDGETRRTATLKGLKLGTTYHLRAVLQVGGRTIRGRDVKERTFGKVLYPEITLKAKRRTATGTSYIGRVGPASLVDTAAACAGSVTVEVYTLQGADLLRRTTKVAQDCTYAIQLPFGATQRARYGAKGSVLVQARFSGNRFVAGAGSKADKP